eukprot:IDg17824t1
MLEEAPMSIILQTQGHRAKTRKQNVLVVALMLLALSPSYLALPILKAKQFSSNFLASFGNGSFTFRAFDLVALRPANRGYVLSASILSVNGEPPIYVNDAPDIERLNKSTLAQKGLGLILRLSSKDLSVRWAIRTCVLPRNGVLRLLALDDGDFLIAGATATDAVLTLPSRVIIRYSGRGKLMYFRKHTGSTPTSYTKIVQPNSKSSVFALADVTSGMGSSSFAVIHLEEIRASDGAVLKTANLTHRKLNGGRLTMAENSLAIGAIGVSKLVVLLRRKSANIEGRSYAVRYVSCLHNATNIKQPPSRCFSAPAAPGTGDAHIAISEQHMFFARLVATGASENLEVTLLNTATLSPIGWPNSLGNRTAIFELPPPESSGARTRTGIAAIAALA